MLARCALATRYDRLLELETIDLDAAADHNVINRNAGVLTQQIVGVLGDFDVPDHGAENCLAGGVGFVSVEALEALLDVGRQHLQRADVELLARFLDLLQIHFHGFILDPSHIHASRQKTYSTTSLRSCTILPHCAVSSRMAFANSPGLLPMGAIPRPSKRLLSSGESSAFIVSR